MERLVMVSLGTLERVPRKAESDCSRIKSKGEEGGVRVSVAVEEVTVTPKMTTLKLRIEGCAGRVSATKVKLRLAWPPPPQLTVQTTPFGPLHEESVRAASKRPGRNKGVLLRFMRHPTTDKSALKRP